MELLSPRSLDEAIAARGAHPGCKPICGGTDVLVELNFDRGRPDYVLDLSHVPELDTIALDAAAGMVRIGAGVPFTKIIAETAELLPGLAIAARTVGSPQIRNRGTLGGNLGTASPAGDALPPLVAAGALVVVAGPGGQREIPARDFVVAPKRSVLAEDEIIIAVKIPVARGPQQFAKLGTRNAMVISVCSFALNLDAQARSFSGAIGSAGPRILVADEACAQLEQQLTESGAWEGNDPLDVTVVSAFGAAVAAAAQPIDDVRGTAKYRRHALNVMARRTLGWIWDEHRGATPRGATVHGRGA